jgi:hypothetical protein
MITASDYLDWQQFSGTCFTHHSELERFRLAARELSAAGAVVLVVGAFLNENNSGLDLFRWREQHVDGLPADIQEKVQRTADALAAVGASKSAAVLPTIGPPTSGNAFTDLLNQVPNLDRFRELTKGARNFQEALAKLQQARPPAPAAKPKEHPPVEALAELRDLLERFVRAHQQELAEDVRRYGDPRQRPGFDPTQRLEEIEQEGVRREQREYQDRLADQFSREFQQLKEAAAGTPPGQAQRILAQATKLHRHYHAWAGPRPPLSEKLARWLTAFDAYRQSRPDLFRRQPTRDEGLLRRLEAIGEYLLEEEGRRFTLTWKSPRGLACDWTALALRFDLPNNDKALASVLDAYDRFAARAGEHFAAFRGELLEHFHLHHDRGLGPFLSKLYGDESGRVVEAKVLAKIDGGRINIKAGGARKVSISASFAVPWDDEHGFETGVVDS